MGWLQKPGSYISTCELNEGMQGRSGNVDEGKMGVPFCQLVTFAVKAIVPTCVADVEANYVQQVINASSCDYI
jgi:hypothetical protein